MCIRKADGKNKTEEDGEKSNYDDESIHPIFEIQASVLGPRSINGGCQG